MPAGAATMSGAVHAGAVHAFFMNPSVGTVVDVILEKVAPVEMIGMACMVGFILWLVRVSDRASATYAKELLEKEQLEASAAKEKLDGAKTTSKSKGRTKAE